MNKPTFLMGMPWWFHVVMGSCIFGSTFAAFCMAKSAYHSRTVLLMDNRWIELGIVMLAGISGPGIGLIVGYILCRVIARAWGIKFDTPEE